MFGAKHLIDNIFQHFPKISKEHEGIVYGHKALKLIENTGVKITNIFNKDMLFYIIIFFYFRVIWSDYLTLLQCILHEYFANIRGKISLILTENHMAFMTFHF